MNHFYLLTFNVFQLKSLLSYLQDFKAVAFAYYKYVCLPNLGEEGEAVKGKEEGIQYY